MLNNQFAREELDQFLHTLLVLDADSAMRVIYNSLVNWVGKTYKSTDESQGIYDQFIRSTHAAIRGLAESDVKYKIQSSNSTPWKSADDVTTELSLLLNQLPHEYAIEFLSELTATWCVACPKEKCGQYWTEEGALLVDRAESLFVWILRPFDYFR